MKKVKPIRLLVFTILIASLLQACSSVDTVARIQVNPMYIDQDQYTQDNATATPVQVAQNKATAATQVQVNKDEIVDEHMNQDAFLNAKETQDAVDPDSEKQTAKQEATDYTETQEEQALAKAEALSAAFDDLPLAPHKLAQGAHYPTADISLYVNERIDNLIYLYTHRYRHIFQRSVVRSAKYMYMIQRVFRANHLPGDLAYLAVIESSFNPKAKSFAHAVGMWQFMSLTARDYGLNVSYWTDERYDAVKSTVAAAKYLKQLHEHLGSWELAIAAYNTGEANVRKAMRRNAYRHLSQDFWSLDLPKETMSYVPAFYAAAILFESLDAYGFTPPKRLLAERHNPKIKVSGGVTLRAIAYVLKMPVYRLRNLNPVLFHSSTPVSRSKYNLVVPRGTRMSKRQAKLIASYQFNKMKHYKVQKGDNLWVLARRFNVKIHELKDANGLHKQNIYIGQNLYVPRSNGVALAKASQSHVRKSRVKHSGFIYRVKGNDNLWKVARRYKVSVKDLKRWNNKGNSIVRLGEKLRIILPTVGRR